MTDPDRNADVFGLAGEAEEHGASGVRVDAGQLDAVRARADAVGPGVTAEQQDVVPAVGASRAWPEAKTAETVSRTAPTLRPA